MGDRQELGAIVGLEEEAYRKRVMDYHVRFTVLSQRVCVYYCRTYYKAVRVGEEDSGGHVL